MDIKTIALILLIFRIIALIFMSYVVKEQIRLLRENNPPDVQTTRWILFAFAAIMLAGNFIPTFVDALTLFADIPRTQPNGIGIAYGLNNAGTDMIQSIILFVFYLYQRRNARLFGRRKTDAEKQ